MEPNLSIILYTVNADAEESTKLRSLLDETGLEYEELEADHDRHSRLIRRFGAIVRLPGVLFNNDWLSGDTDQIANFLQEFQLGMRSVVSSAVADTSDTSASVVASPAKKKMRDGTVLMLKLLSSFPCAHHRKPQLLTYCFIVDAPRIQSQGLVSEPADETTDVPARCTSETAPVAQLMDAGAASNVKDVAQPILGTQYLSVLKTLLCARKKEVQQIDARKRMLINIILEMIQECFSEHYLYVQGMALEVINLFSDIEEYSQAKKGWTWTSEAVAEHMVQLYQHMRADTEMPLHERPRSAIDFLAFIGVVEKRILADTNALPETHRRCLRCTNYVPLGNFISTHYFRRRGCEELYIASCRPCAVQRREKSRSSGHRYRQIYINDKFALYQFEQNGQCPDPHRCCPFNRPHQESFVAFLGTHYPHSETHLFVRPPTRKSGEAAFAALGLGFEREVFAKFERQWYFAARYSQIESSGAEAEGERKVAAGAQTTRTQLQARSPHDRIDPKYPHTEMTFGRSLLSIILQYDHKLGEDFKTKRLSGMTPKQRCDEIKKFPIQILCHICHNMKTHRERCIRGFELHGRKGFDFSFSIEVQDEKLRLFEANGCRCCGVHHRPCAEGEDCPGQSCSNVTCPHEAALSDYKKCLQEVWMDDDDSHRMELDPSGQFSAEQYFSLMVLELDHVDPSLKSDNVGNIRDPVLRAAEMAKCQLICCWCHSAKTELGRDTVGVTCDPELLQPYRSKASSKVASDDKKLEIRFEDDDEDQLQPQADDDAMDEEMSIVASVESETDKLARLAGELEVSLREKNAKRYGERLVRQEQSLISKAIILFCQVHRLLEAEKRPGDEAEKLFQALVDQPEEFVRMIFRWVSARDRDLNKETTVRDLVGILRRFLPVFLRSMAEKATNRSVANQP